EFPEREVPADRELHLKKGARVMCLANDQVGRYANGSLGWVRGFSAEGGSASGGEEAPEMGSSVLIELDDGGRVSIASHTWTVYRSVYDKKTKSLDQEKLGSFTQIPLKLAWAVTVHKGQGKTFNQVAIDLGRGAFAAGQTYVALSRCCSFEGLTLMKPVKLQDIRLDYSIVKFVTKIQYALAEKEMPLEKKIEHLRSAACAGKRLKITYLKGKDEKSERVIIPRSIEEDEYAGHEFLALRAWCESRQEERTFNVERILSITAVEQ
ncbi:MAG: WYL domain-containing protein, partial [Candidatus Uhrbacteria bacterium]|nr:WYL domain-containing protein [Candidatus Uhrbacteria bacterium]